MKNTEIFSFLTGLQRFGWRLGLDNIRELLSRIGNPEKELAAIHIAGSNGKGSTAVFLESVLRAAGLKTGLYTSPHLVDVTERIRVNRSPIPLSGLGRILTELRPDIEKIGCTYFEALTAAAFFYFREQEVDVAILEVGLGGRFDATNVIEPLLSIITTIDLEHTDHLGTTIEEIAAEKAGIIKTGVPCLIQTQEPAALNVFGKICESRRARLIRLADVCKLESPDITDSYSAASVAVNGGFAGPVRTSMIGMHQLRNAAIAITAASTCLPTFNIDHDAIRNGIADASWTGRLQSVSFNPRVILDVAHNPATFRAILGTIRQVYRCGKMIVIVGVLKDKNYSEIARLIAASAEEVLVVTPDSERALEKEILAAEFEKQSCMVQIKDSIKRAFATANRMATPSDLILVTGSHYVVGEFLENYPAA